MDSYNVGREVSIGYSYDKPEYHETGQIIVADPLGRVVDTFFQRFEDRLLVEFVPYMEGEYLIFETVGGRSFKILAEDI